MRNTNISTDIEKACNTQCWRSAHHIRGRHFANEKFIDKVVLEPRVSPEHTSKYVDTVTVFAKTWTKGHWPLDDLWPHICWGLMCDCTQGSLCPSPMKIHQSMRIQWPFFAKNLKQRSLTPRWPLTPHLLRSHVWLYSRIIVSKSHENTSILCGYSDLFAKNLKKRSLTPRWLLTPHLLRSHVWLYPRIIVSKSHENTSKYVDTVTRFAKTWTKGHWPLDDLWPHIGWGRMCDSTQGSFCPSPMKIHECMWIQWPFLHKNLNQRSLTPRWPLTPHLLRSHVWLYLRIIVSKSHENTSKYVDTVNLFAKNLNQRSLTPRWPLTPHLLRSHVWLYPRIILSKSHGNTLMYVDTVINFANYHIHTHTTYRLYTTN